ncbi:MAG: hypothetical protein KZQ70_08815, partial [gamma proteobacterium symbiont of Lucinoma myriamae]|nr:hypothetical protein [gamma proteobacterium symbiont of Lucinoma myriamae]
KNKILADFSQSIVNKESSHVLKCITHVNGLKCEFQIDNDLNTVIITGVGHKMWREYVFPKVTKILFRQYVEETDSQVCESQIEELETVRNHEEVPQEKSAVTYGQHSCNVNADIPMLTSTPIAQRSDNQHCSINYINTPSVLSIFQKLQQMENELRELKQTIVASMEMKITDLKSVLVKTIDQMTTEKNVFQCWAKTANQQYVI